jgi:hypothetical protein
MNKRIEELAMAAGLVYIRTPDNPFIDEDLEKFAELIVQECVKSLRKAFPQMTPNEIANMLLKGE